MAAVAVDLDLDVDPAAATVPGLHVENALPALVDAAQVEGIQDLDLNHQLVPFLREDGVEEINEDILVVFRTQQISHKDIRHWVQRPLLPAHGPSVPLPDG